MSSIEAMNAVNLKLAKETADEMLALLTKVWEQGYEAGAKEAAIKAAQTLKHPTYGSLADLATDIEKTMNIKSIVEDINATDAAIKAAQTTKWCSHCKVDSHDDAECWSTRMVPPSKELVDAYGVAIPKEQPSAISDERPGWVSEVSAELEKAVTKFPTWPTDPIHAVAVLGEEFGELTKAVLQWTYEPHKTSLDEIRTETIQTVAMGVRFLKSLDVYEYRKCDQHAQSMLAAAPKETK